MKDYFYIIHRDGQIFEIENLGNRFSSSMKLWQDGGVVVFPTLGMGINTNDITKILNSEQYSAFVDSAQPKMFIKNGAWYEIRDRNNPIRYEKWRQDQIDNNKRDEIEGPKVSQEQVDGWLKKYRPQVVQDKMDLAKKIKIVNEIDSNPLINQ